MQFQIVTPERVVFSDNVEQVSMMTEDGEITVLPHHIPLVSTLKPGELRYKKQGEEFAIAVSGGFGVVRENDTIMILADTAEHPEEINLARAEEARARAVKLMEDVRSKEHVDYSLLQIKLEKELNRLRVGNKYRK